MPAISIKLTTQFSDEFNKDGRTFYEDDDPYLQGMDFWYGVTQDLEVRICHPKLKTTSMLTKNSGMTLTP